MVARTLKRIVVLAALYAGSYGTALADSIKLNGLPCNELCQWWMGVTPADRLRADLRSAQPDDPLPAEPAAPRKKHLAVQATKKRLSHSVAQKALAQRFGAQLPSAPARPAPNPAIAGGVDRAVAPPPAANAAQTAPAPIVADVGQESKPAELSAAPKADAAPAAAKEASVPVVAADNPAPKPAEAPTAPQSDAAPAAALDAPARVVAADNPAPKPVEVPVASQPDAASAAAQAAPASAAPSIAAEDPAAKSAETQAAPHPDATPTEAQSVPAPAAPMADTAPAPTAAQETATLASADPPPSAGRVLILLARPEIRQIGDVGDSSIILAGSFPISKEEIATTLSAASAKPVTVVEGSKGDIDRLISGEVSVVVAALLSPAAAKDYPDLSGLNVFRVPLAPP